MLDRKDATQVIALSDHFAFPKQALLAHEEGEEEILFPALEHQIQHVADSYIFDHEHQNMTVIDDVEEILHSLAKAPDSELQERLNRQSIALNVMPNLHVLKENELLMPILYTKFDTEEQAEIMQKMSGHIPPEVALQWMSGTFRALRISDRESLARTMKQLVPEEHFGGLVQIFRDFVSEQEWQELTQRLPKLLMKVRE
jgi:iron-sulfur cluster repair protein YtfE (RIC family)